MPLPFRWPSRPTDPESRPRILPGGCALPQGMRAQRVRTWHLSRALYRVRHVALADVPAAQRRAALRSQLLAWEPFDSADYLAALRGDAALAFAWDARAVGDALEAVGAAGSVMPEGLLRSPMTGDGVRMLRCLEGVEAQCWSHGLQLASRWWPEVPDTAAWTDFARSVPGVAGRPELTDVPWLNQPWIEVQSPQALSARWSRIEQLVAGVAAVGLVGLSAAQAADAYRVHSEAAMLSAELDRVRESTAPMLAARDKALATLGEIQALSRNLQGVPPIAVLRHLAEVLPAKGVTLREFDLSGTTLRLGLDLAPEVQRSAVVKDLQSGGWFAGVAEARDGGGRTGLTFEMRLTALQPPVVAPRAARAASAPGVASPTPKGAP